MKKMLAAMTAVLMLTGCGTNSAPAEKTEPVTAPPSAVSESTNGNTEAESSSLVSDTILELSLFAPGGTTEISAKLGPDMPVMAELTKKTNVVFNFTTGTKDELNEKFPLMMADPSQITDIVATSITNLNKFGQEGAFIPLNDYMQDYPNIKKHITDNPAVMKEITAADGNIYCIPGLPAHMAGEVWYIRKDWLDQLNLEIPTNLEELKTVLKAFKTEDPNGNGEADEVPLWFASAKDIRKLSWAFGIDNNWFINENNEPEFGPVNPAYRDFIAYMQELYAEELMDREYLTRTGNKRDFFLHGNIGGLVHSFAGATGRYNETAPQVTQDEDFELIAIPPFKTEDGRQIERTGGLPVGSSGFGISMNNKHVEETMKLIDYLMSDEGQVLMNFGVEGLSYDMIDGYPTYREDFFTNGINMDELMATGAQVNFWPYLVDIRYEDQTTGDAYNYAKDLYENNGYIVGAFPNIQFTKEEQKVVDKYKSQMTDYVDEMSTKWISGKEPLDSFDEFVTTLKETMGLNELQTVYNEAYRRYDSIK